MVLLLSILLVSTRQRKREEECSVAVLPAKTKKRQALQLARYINAIVAMSLFAKDQAQADCHTGAKNECQKEVKAISQHEKAVIKRDSFCSARGTRVVLSLHGSSSYVHASYGLRRCSHIVVQYLYLLYAGSTALVT